MHPRPRIQRWMAGALLAALVTAVLAPAVQADHKKKRRYKYVVPVRETRGVTHYHSPRSVYVVRRSSAGPVIAGFLGGVFLGATLANAAPAGFTYYDPYCDQRFVSLEVYGTHLHRHHHPGIVRVIEVESGDCLHTYYWKEGKLKEWDDDDWDDWDDD